MAFVKKITCQQCLYVELWADNPEQADVSRRKLVLVYCVVFGITAALVAVPWIWPCSETARLAPRRLELMRSVPVHARRY